MPTPTKRLRCCSCRCHADDANQAMKTAAAAPDFPLDLLLQIVLFCDFATIVSWAATSKQLRLAILDDGFRRRRADLAAARDSFNPGLLQGVSCYCENRAIRRLQRGLPAVCQIHTTRPLSGRLDGLNTSIKRLGHRLRLVASRGNLIVFECDNRGFCDPTLYACNTLTGNITFHSHRHRFGFDTSADIFRPALLTVGGVADADSSFELLICYLAGHVDRGPRSSPAATAAVQAGAWLAPRRRRAHGALAQPRRPARGRPRPHHPRPAAATASWDRDRAGDDDRAAAGAGLRQRDDDERRQEHRRAPPRRLAGREAEAGRGAEGSDSYVDVVLPGRGAQDVEPAGGDQQAGHRQAAYRNKIVRFSQAYRVVRVRHDSVRRVWGEERRRAPAHAPAWARAAQPRDEKGRLPLEQHQLVLKCNNHR